MNWRRATTSFCGLLAALVLLTAVPAYADDLMPLPEPPAIDEGPGEEEGPVEQPVVIDESGGEEPAPVVFEEDVGSAPYLEPAPLQARAPLRTSGCCQPRDECGWPLNWCGQKYGRWNFAIEGSFSFAPSPEGDLGEAVPPGTPNMSWETNNFDPEVGARATLSYAIRPRDRIELRAQWWGEFEDSSNQIGAFGFNNLPGVSPIFSAQLESELDMFGIEANWWREICCRGKTRWSVGAGVRYIAISETASVNNIVGLAPDSRLQSDVDNEFFGAQIMAAVAYDVDPRFELGASAKILLGAMRSDVEIKEASILSGGPHSARDDEGAFGWGFELGLSALYRLTSSTSLTLGYGVLVLGEVVHAHEAMDFSKAATGAVQAQQESDTFVIHSFYLGVGFNW